MTARMGRFRTLRAFRAVFANPDQRRVELAFLLFVASKWGTRVTLLVFARAAPSTHGIGWAKPTRASTGSRIKSHRKVRWLDRDRRESEPRRVDPGQDRVDPSPAHPDSMFADGHSVDHNLDR